MRTPSNRMFSGRSLARPGGRGRAGPEIERAVVCFGIQSPNLDLQLRFCKDF